MYDFVNVIFLVIQNEAEVMIVCIPPNAKLILLPLM